MNSIAAMLQLLGLALASQLTGLSSAEGQRLVVHEKQESEFMFTDVVNRKRIDADVVLPMRISLRQNENALKNAESWIMATADPDSPMYGEYWSLEDVISAFAPADESVQIVSDWLRNNGILKFTHSENKQWIAFDISAAQAEKLLETEYFEHEKQYTKDDGIAFEASCNQYKLPKAVSRHVDFIKPGLKSVELTGATARSREHLARTVNGVHYKPSPSDSQFPPLRFPKPLPSANELKTCWNFVTPTCIRALYNIPLTDPSQAVSSSNTLGLFETKKETYYQPALDQFYSAYAPYIPNGTAPLYHRVDNATSIPPTSYRGPDWRDVGSEEMLDLDVSIPIIYPQKADVYLVRTPGYTLSSIDRFADVIDGSYCKKPQPNTHEGVKECGVFKPNNVVSFSWGVNEAGLPKPHSDRLCLEFLKLGLQGTSVFFASGDAGVSWIQRKSVTEASFCNDPKMHHGPQLFGPGFPVSCPWVTAVGATKLRVGTSVDSGEVAATFWSYDYVNNSTTVGGVSGGGFSLDFDRPSYQNEAVTHFFETADPPWNYFYNGHFRNSTGGYLKGRYNRNGRGYPDVSSNGFPIVYVWETKFRITYGTSAAAPTWGSILNRIVEERIRAGKGPVGFINPVLYKNPHAMNDITDGGNGVCLAKDGFECAPGWDPVTGLGTPNYPKLLDVFMALP